MADPLGQVTEFPVPTAGSLVPPNGLPFGGLAVGPDGNVWFTEPSGDQIGRINPSGAISEFPLPISNAEPSGIVAGPDGNLWFTQANAAAIGRITSSGVVTELPINTPAFDIAAGPDGNLWFTEENETESDGEIGRITPGGAVTQFPIPARITLTYGVEITVGPDGNLWFTMPNNFAIGRITPSGTVTVFPLPAGGIVSSPVGIAAGPDGAVWFTQQVNTAIGRITPSGQIAESALPAGSPPNGIASGPDGRLWFTDFDNSIGETLGGGVSPFALPSAGAQPGAIVAGPDGNLWFTEPGTNSIARIGTGSPTPPEFSPPVISVYAANNLANDLSEYTTTTLQNPLTGSAAGALTAIGRIATGSTPFGVAVSPDGKSVYVTNGGAGSISQYSVLPGGTLVPKSPATVPAGGQPFGIAVTPDGANAYVTNGQSSTISEYAVGPGEGLEPMGTVSEPGLTTPQGVAVSPDGHNVYVTSESGDTVWHFRNVFGSLELGTGPHVAAGSGPRGVAVSPDGRDVYVSNYFGGTVSQYAIGSGGVLSQIAPAVSSGLSPLGITVAYFGGDLYVTNVRSNTVSQFAIRSGALASLSPATVSTGEFPDGVAASTDGLHVYVGEAFSGVVGMFSVGSSGGLFPLAPFQIGSGAATGGIAATALPPGEFLGCQVTRFGSICFYQDRSGVCDEWVNGGPTTTISCGPRWVHFRLSRHSVAATLKLHLTTRFRVLVKSTSGRLLKRISLGRLRSGLTRVRFRLRGLGQGTYTLVIEALPAGKKPVLGPNPLTLHLTADGNGTGSFSRPRRASQQALAQILAHYRKRKKSR
jgi:streptogramin lyase